MAEQPVEEHREMSINVLTGIALFVYLLALFVIVSFDGWFFHWTTP